MPKPQYIESHFIGSPLETTESYDDSTPANALTIAGITGVAMAATESLLGAPEVATQITSGSAVVFLVGAVAYRLYNNTKS